MIEEIKFDPEAYSWRSEAVARHESLWSLLHKFAAFNSADSLGVKRTLAKNRYKDDYFGNLWRWKDRADLRDFGALDPSILAKAFHVTRGKLDESVVSLYLNPGEARWLTCAELRYCENCLKLGFHSVFYQMLFLINCPIHPENAFKTTCANCHAKIPYHLNTKTFKYPYRCSTCNHPFTSVVDDPRNSLDMKGRGEVFESLQKWLVERKKLNLIDRQIIKLQPGIFDKYGSEREFLFANLIHHWSNIIKPSGSAKQYVKRQAISKRLKHSRMTYKITSAKFATTSTDPKLLDKDLYRIYKAIRRSLLRTLLADHRLCIEKYGRLLFWDRQTITCEGSICVEANAYILWRMYFEELTHPISLFKKFRPTPTNYFDRPSILWQRPPHDMPEFVLKKLFSLECYWVFSECRTLSKSFYDDNVYSLNPRFVKGHEVPQWIVKSKDKSIELHWWNERKTISDNYHSDRCVT